MFTREIHDNVYGVRYLFVASDDTEKAAANKRLYAFLKGWPDFEPIDGENGVCFSYRTESKIAIWMSLEPDMSCFMATLAHEALHAAHSVFQWRGVHWNPELGMQEAQCYYLAWIVREAGYGFGFDRLTQRPASKSSSTSGKRRASSKSKTRKRNKPTRR